MDAAFRQHFNQFFTPGLYHRYRTELSRRLGVEFQFRLAETPVFLPSYLRERMVASAREIVTLLCEPGRLAKMQMAIPPQWDTPGMSGLPSFVQVDLAVVRGEDGLLEPRLIELQGFPSLTAMQVIQRDVWNEVLQDVPGMQGEWSCWFSGLDRADFMEIARRTILGDHEPENVILMDLDPPSQKTLPDFCATRILFGVEAVCPTRLHREGRRLFRRTPEGKLVPVHRIYNRVVFDELIRKNLRLPFDYREPLDVEWAPHPNWYWAWSKNSIVHLDHPAVPRAILLSDFPGIPGDLSARYVLKPLFSFAGGGVKVDPEPADIERIPEPERRNWCLQEKVTYEPAILSAEGPGVKVEVRMMFLTPDDAPDPILCQNLCRLSRGAMLGVDFNKSFTWVGSSVGLWPAGGSPGS